MNSLVINIFIVLLNTCILVNLTTAETVLSEVSCRYSGLFESENENCHKDVVKLKTLPESCKSFVFDGVTCNADYSITTPTPNDLEILQSLIDFDNQSRSVFLFYKHATSKDWNDALLNGDHNLEAGNVHEFVGKYAVKGLILNGIDSSELFTVKTFYQKFKDYIKSIKAKNDDLEIGLYLSARNFVIGGTNLLDFSKINENIDFFLMEFATFNECTDDLLRGGITPDQSSNSNIMTLTKFKSAFNGSIIDHKKVFFEFLVSPMSKPGEKENFLACEISYNEYCENVDDYRPIWCIDDNVVLYKKGQLAKQFSNGFVARDIDLIDRDNKCNCNDKFITFNILLSGYKGEAPLTCDALKII